jgi:DNA-binding NtrC family response regulator
MSDPANSSRTALVVDDEDQLLRLISRLLERSGYRVLAAADAAAARRLFTAHAEEIELLLLDVVLPDGDGAEQLLPEFLEDRDDFEVIAMSGDAAPETLEAMLERIGGRFLRKPFAPKSLLRMLDADSTAGEAR